MSSKYSQPETAERRGQRRLGRWLAYVFGGLLSALVAFAIWQRHAITNVARSWDDFSQGSALARELRGPQDLLEYIANHAADVSLVAYRLDDEARGISLNADQPRPLGATIELLLLCHYNQSIALAELRPDASVRIDDWETYWLPPLDGGAHDRTLAELRASNYAASDRVQIQDLVYGMVRFSDDAAADYLMQRIGRTQLEGLPAHYGMQAHSAPLPFSGMYLSWQSTQQAGAGEQPIERLRVLGSRAYADEVWRLTAALRDDPQRRQAERERLRGKGSTLTLREQAALVRAHSPRGRARDYARLLARVQRGELPGSDDTRNQLQWPVELPELRDRFDELGTKGGSLPGMLSSASFATPKGSDSPRVVALFFETLPMAVWLELMHNSLHQRFAQELLSDDAFFERARQRLAGTPGS